MKQKILFQALLPFCAIFITAFLLLKFIPASNDSRALITVIGITIVAMITQKIGKNVIEQTKK